MENLSFLPDKNSKIKLYKQLCNKIVELIENSEISIGEKLPSVRTLSIKANIARNTVTKAYKELEKIGYLHSIKKSGFYANKPSSFHEIKNSTFLESGTIISKEKTKSAPKSKFLSNRRKSNLQKTGKNQNQSSDTKKLKRTQKKTKNSKLPIILNSGYVIKESEDNFEKTQTIDQALLKSYENTILSKQNILHTTSNSFGEESFKIAIASFLYNFRKLDVDPNQIIVCAGYEQLLSNIISLNSLQNPKTNIEGMGLLRLAENSLFTQITPRIALPEEENLKIKHIFEKENFEVTEIPFNENEMNLDFLSTSGATLSYISTSRILNNSIFPMQNNISNNYLEWASLQNYRYLIIYDDSSLPKENSPIEPLDEKIIYICSLSNLISNYINASFAILPKNLLAEYKTSFEDFDCSLSKLDQLALTDFIISGKLIYYLTNVKEI